MSLHPIMASALAPFAPASSEVHRIAALPGIEARELNTPEDFADSLAGDLELQAIEPDEFTKKLQRAGFVARPSARSEGRRVQDPGVAADLAYMHLKNSGELERREVHRAVVEQAAWDEATGGRS